MTFQMSRAFRLAGGQADARERVIRSKLLEHTMRRRGGAAGRAVERVHRGFLKDGFLSETPILPRCGRGVSSHDDFPVRAQTSEGGPMGPPSFSVVAGASGRRQVIAGERQDADAL